MRPVAIGWLLVFGALCASSCRRRGPISVPTKIDGLCGDPKVMAWFEQCRKTGHDESNCEAAGGSWQQVGSYPVNVCKCPAGQQGCKCHKYDDCLAGCGAAPTGDMSCEGVVEGTCNSGSQTVGCGCWLRPSGRFEYICID